MRRLQVLKRSGKPWGLTGSLWLSHELPGGPHPCCSTQVTFSPGSQQSLQWLSLAAAPASLSGYSQGEGSRFDCASPLSGTLQWLLVLLKIKSELCNVVQRSCKFWSLPTLLTSLGTSLAPWCWISHNSLKGPLFHASRPWYLQSSSA